MDWSEGCGCDEAKGGEGRGRCGYTAARYSMKALTPVCLSTEYAVREDMRGLAKGGQDVQCPNTVACQ